MRKRFLSKGKDRALLDIISVMNQPVRDEQILQAAGVQLEQMLFPLLVAVGRHGPVGELADHLGRDNTTVSRQVKKLEAQGSPVSNRTKFSRVAAPAQQSSFSVTNHGSARRCCRKVSPVGIANR